MGLTYLPRWAFALFIFSLIILTANLGVIGFILCTLIFAILILVFRSAKKDLREDSGISNDIILSPVNGRVVKITKNVDHDFFGKDYTCVVLSVPFWKQLGLFFPATSEIEDVQASSEKSLDHLVKFKLSSGLEIGLGVGQNILRLLPKIVVLPGDRGKQKMNFGYLPFGGEIKVYVPSTLEVLINIKDEVVAGQGVLAGIPTKLEE
jgi:phosphatidylserine decarboxylase